MTQYTTRPIVSGRAYPVLQAADQRAARLEDFLGSTRFMLDLDGEVYTVYGFGRQVEDGVRFHQKDIDGVGRDIRRWAVRRAAPGGFVAEHVIH